MNAPVLGTALDGIPRYATGKVRDIYDLGDTLLLVTTDRISAFDVVMPNGIPCKGAVLTQLSRHWFRRLRSIVPTHYVTTDEDLIMDRIQEAGGRADAETHRLIQARAMMGIKTTPFPIECVVRGYLAGSLWKEYVQAGGAASDVQLHGITLSAGMRESDELPHPVFTPATKAESGHDENISFEQAAAIVGVEAARQLQRISMELYTTAADIARARGIIVADTKFEFGLHRGTITLIDEALTPDSSRFWDAATYQPGRSQPSYDKQYVRDWLLASGWNREPPAPVLPDDVVQHTSDSYLKAYSRIVGRPLA